MYLHSDIIYVAGVLCSRTENDTEFVLLFTGFVLCLADVIK